MKVEQRLVEMNTSDTGTAQQQGARRAREPIDNRPAPVGCARLLCWLRSDSVIRSSCHDHPMQLSVIPRTRPCSDPSATRHCQTFEPSRAAGITVIVPAYNESGDQIGDTLGDLLKSIAARPQKSS